jgi:hypothetical protein
MCCVVKILSVSTCPGCLYSLKFEAVYTVGKEISACQQLPTGIVMDFYAPSLLLPR